MTVTLKMGPEFCENIGLQTKCRAFFVVYRTAENGKIMTKL